MGSLCTNERENKYFMIVCYEQSDRHNLQEQTTPQEFSSLQNVCCQLSQPPQEEYVLVASLTSGMSIWRWLAHPSNCLRKGTSSDGPQR
jgi:hypothetical protein